MPFQRHLLEILPYLFSKLPTIQYQTRFANPNKERKEGGEKRTPPPFWLFLFKRRPVLGSLVVFEFTILLYE
jgi:hypothetical protein